MAVVGDVEPAPDLGVPVEGQDIVADGLVVVPDRLGFSVVDPGRAAGLLAEVEAFFVAEDEVALDGAAGRAGQADAGGGAPGPRREGQAVADDHVVVGVQAVGDLVEDAGVLVVGDQAVAHLAVLVADVEPDAVAAIVGEGAVLQDGPAGQADLVAAGLPAAVEALGVVVPHGAAGQQQAVGVAGPEAELAVVLEGAIANDDVLAREDSAPLALVYSKMQSSTVMWSPENWTAPCCARLAA